jgi:hypothetical protein
MVEIDVHFLNLQLAKSTPGRINDVIAMMQSPSCDVLCRNVIMSNECLSLTFKHAISAHIIRPIQS